MLPSQAHDMATAISRTIMNCLQQQQSKQTSQPRGSSVTASCSISHAAPAARVVSSQPNTSAALPHKHINVFLVNIKSV